MYALAEEKKVCRTPELNLSAQMPPVVTIEADEWLTDGQTVETAGISFQVIATPGHTVGGCCYYCKEGGFLFSGDTLFEESVGRTDFPTGSMSSLVRSVKEKLFVLPEDTKVYPGHGDITTIEGRSSTIPTASKKMIIVTLNEDRYAYDIHSLVKAFYPEQEIKVFVKGTKEERSDAGLPAFFVEFDETSICAGIEDGGTKTVNLKTPEDRGTVKNDLKQLLYALLSEETKKTLPWGTLTGIRPTKIAKQLLEQGQTEQEVAAYMEHTYLASKEKKRSCRLTLPNGKCRFYPEFIMRKDTAFISGFRSAQRPVCIVPLPLFRSVHGKIA